MQNIKTLKYRPSLTMQKNKDLTKKNKLKEKQENMKKKTT